MPTDPLALAKQLPSGMVLTVAEIAYLLDITEPAVRRIIGKTLPKSPTVADVLQYAEDHPNRLARRMTRKRLKYFVWLTPADAERLVKAGFKVVNPRKKDLERRAANRANAIERLKAKADA